MNGTMDYNGEHFIPNKQYQSCCKGLFTVSISISVCDDAKKWVQLISMELFTFNDAKH